MHLTGGLFKGRIISTPKGGDIDVRPTLSKVRESIFNMLISYYTDFSKLSFLDMFTGSGIMALEAYSRGFKKITAIECNPKTYAAVKKTYASFEKAETEINLIKGNSLKILSKLDDFDVIYIDPPWDYNYEPIILAALEKVASNGVVIVEYDKKTSSCSFQNTSIPSPFKEKIYGRTKINFYRK